MGLFTDTPYEFYEYGNPQMMLGVIQDHHGTQIAAIYNRSKAKDHARHIIDCMNACDGMEDPVKDMAALKARITTLESALQHFTYLNKAHYKDIVGFIQKAEDALKTD